MSLPAADELFRTTGGSAVQPSSPANQNHANGEELSGKSTPSTTRVPAPAGDQDAAGAAENASADGASAEDDPAEDGERSEHSAADEGDDPAAESAAASGGAPAAEAGEHTGREGGDQQDEQSAPRRTVPGQGAPRGTAGRSGGGEITSRQTGPSGPAGPSGAVGPAGGSAAKSPQQPKSPRPDGARGRQQAGGSARRGGRGANRRPSGRERHDEKITVYVSAEELMDLEHARLVLRGEHGLAVDRGRIVREAVAVVLADLESRGDASILVRRLRGR
ncbi:hypothetical protein [Streptomyces winkii]|uniref:hypothetical protein n=1 Tax=Streptomyces winkii TaxID=3051178 RepID=UPI0028D145E4|nr:hypothetical protein [Streptomyces sp. DSM 40971]